MLSGQHGATCKKTLGQGTPMPSLSYYITEVGRDQVNDISIMGHPPLCSHSCPLGPRAGSRSLPPTLPVTGTLYAL